MNRLHAPSAPAANGAAGTEIAPDLSEPFIPENVIPGIPPQRPALVRWDAAGGNLCLVYHERVIFAGQVSGGGVQLENRVRVGHGLEQRLVLSGKSLVLSAVVHGSEQMLAAETRGMAQERFPLVRTSHGLSRNLRNNAVYDRRWDWQLAAELGAVRIVPEMADAQSRDFTFRVSGDGIELVFRPRFYQKHKGIAFFEPWNYTVREDSIAGWCSWYAHYTGCTQEHCDALLAVWREKRLADFGYRFIQLDHCYANELGRGQERPLCAGGTRDFPSRGPATWLDWRRDAFPAGIHGYVAACRNAGCEPGIWVGVHITDAELVEQHPDWFVRDETGKPFVACWVSCAVDATVDEAAKALIRPTFAGLRRAGFAYVKIDLLRHYLYDNIHGNLDYCRKRGVTPAQILRSYLKPAREALGTDTFVLACWGVLPESVGLVDACRVAGDGFGPASMQCYNSWNGIVWRNDPDAIEIGKSAADAVIRPALASIAGNLLLLSDQAEVYRDDLRLEGARRSAPVLFSVPGQLYDYHEAKSATLLTQPRETIKTGVDPAPCDANQEGAVCPWWLNEFNIAGVGQWSVLHRVNWGDRSPSTTVAFADIGLEAATYYLVYEFWTARCLGVKRGQLDLPEAGAREIRSYALRPLESHPQIVSTNRHLSQGGVDLVTVSWRNSALSGVSRVVQGDCYELVVHIPAGFMLKSAEFDGMPALTVLDGTVLRASFVPDTTRHVSWKLDFDTGPQSSYVL